MPDNEPVNAWALGMRDLIGPGEETPTGPDVALADIFAALRDPLADLTAFSASTTVRTAILNQRAALDALLGQLETP